MAPSLRTRSKDVATGEATAPRWSNLFLTRVAIAMLPSRLPRKWAELLGDDDLLAEETVQVKGFGGPSVPGGALFGQQQLQQQDNTRGGAPLPSPGAPAHGAAG
eukprot:1149389-Pelagomonas_calceolata.AAC.3